MHQKNPAENLQNDIVFAQDVLQAGCVGLAGPVQSIAERADIEYPLRVQC